MTRQEAEKLAKELNEKKPTWFCPLIKEVCRADCVNFIPAFVKSTNEESNGMLHDIKDNDFEVEGYVCSNAMFAGGPAISCG